MLPVCRELGICFVCYSPLGRGALTGHFRDVNTLEQDDARRDHPRFMGENYEKNLLLVSRVEKIAKEKGCQASQLALAWLLAQGNDIVPIPGMKKVSYLEENIKSLDLKLTAEDLRKLNEAAPYGTVAGAPYPTYPGRE